MVRYPSSSLGFGQDSGRATEQGRRRQRKAKSVSLGSGQERTLYRRSATVSRVSQQEKRVQHDEWILSRLKPLYLIRDFKVREIFVLELSLFPFIDK